jgi:hypothetical protein
MHKPFLAFLLFDTSYGDGRSEHGFYAALRMSTSLPVGQEAVLAVQQVLPQTGRALHRDWTCKPVAAEEDHTSLNRPEIPFAAFLAFSSCLMPRMQVQSQALSWALKQLPMSWHLLEEPFISISA